MSFTVMLRRERMAFKGTHSMRRPNMAVKLPVGTIEDRLSCDDWRYHI